VFDVEYFPPITNRDLDAAVADGIEVVGIIDVAFIQTYSVTPAQILRHLRDGIVIFGAASGGALRAVEADAFGMRGVGGIYRLFRNGFEAEDELAVSYDPDSLRPLSEAMINVRYALRRALSEGVVSQHTHEIVAKVAKDIYFPDRTYKAVFERASAIVSSEELSSFVEFVEDNRVTLDWKRADAIECLQSMGRYLAKCEERALLLEARPRVRA
jgi:hypothetical protein